LSTDSLNLLPFFVPDKNYRVVPAKREISLIMLQSWSGQSPWGIDRAAAYVVKYYYRIIAYLHAHEMAPFITRRETALGDVFAVKI